MKIKINQGNDASSAANTTLGAVSQAIAEDYGDEEPVYVPDAATRRPGNPVVSREDVLDFDYFPDIAKDEITMNCVQHTEETVKAEREAYEKHKAAEEQAEFEKSKKNSLSFLIGIVYLILSPITGVLLSVLQSVGMIFAILYIGDIAGFVIGVVDLMKDNKKKAGAGLAMCLIAVILVAGIMFGSNYLFSSGILSGIL